MEKNLNTAESYANIILADERAKIVSETPTIYEDDLIERIYEFADGAIVKYEWQSLPREDSSTEKYNHRFTLLSPPAPNPNKYKKEIIKQINYPSQFDCEQSS